MSPGDIGKIVRPDHPNLGPSVQRRFLDITRSSLQCRPVPVRDETPVPMKAVDRLFTA